MSGRYKLERVQVPWGKNDEEMRLEFSDAEWRCLVKALVAYANRSVRKDYDRALKLARRIAEAQGLEITDDKT